MVRTTQNRRLATVNKNSKLPHLGVLFFGFAVEFFVNFFQMLVGDVRVNLRRGDT